METALPYLWVTGFGAFASGYRVEFLRAFFFSLVVSRIDTTEIESMEIVHTSVGWRWSLVGIPGPA